jgi:hypothetical protein
LRTSAPSILIDIDAARGRPDRLVRELATMIAPSAGDALIESIARDIGTGSYRPSAVAAGRN